MLHQKTEQRAQLTVMLLLAILLNIVLLYVLFVPQIDLELKNWFARVNVTDSELSSFDPISFLLDDSVDQSSSSSLPPLIQAPQSSQPSAVPVPPPPLAGSPTLRSGPGVFGAPAGDYDATASDDVLVDDSQDQMNETDSNQDVQQIVSDQSERSANSDEQKESAALGEKKTEHDSSMSAPKSNAPESTLNEVAHSEVVSRKTEKSPVLQSVRNGAEKPSSSEARAPRASGKKRKKKQQKQNFTFEQLARGFIHTLNRGGSGVLDRDGDGSTVASKQDLILQAYMKRLIWAFQNNSRQEPINPALLSGIPRSSVFVTLKIALYDTGILDSVEVVKPSPVHAFDQSVCGAFKSALFPKVPAELLNQRHRFETIVNVYG